MKTAALLVLLAGISHAQYTFVPVHGCTWITEFTALTNFSLTLPNPTTNTTTTNTTLPATLSFTVPLISTTCTASSTNLTSFGAPSVRTLLSCGGGGSSYNGTLVLSQPVTDGPPSNATMTWSFYTGCAASIFEFGYRAVVGLSCGSADGDVVRCGASGSATAGVVYENWLPPIRPPPPPPFVYIPPVVATSTSASGFSTVVATATAASVGRA